MKGGETLEDGKMTKSDWVSRVDELLKTGEDYANRKQMIINLNYYVSNQWIGWDNAARSVRSLPHDGQERITHNVIQPRVMTKLAKQTKNRIKYDVVPDTSDEARAETAKAATKFLHVWWDEQEVDLKTRDSFLYGNVNGWCAAKVFFDREAGKDITPDEKDPGYEEDQQSIHMGEIKMRICNPLTLYIDPAATTEDEIRWIVEEKPRDVDYIKDTYGIDVPPDDTVTYAPSFDITNNSLGNLGGDFASRKNKRMAMVRELWMKPCKKYPNGLKITTTRAEFLDKDENAGELPYVLFGDIPIPGTVKYKSFIESMLPIQRSLNISLTMFATNMKKMGSTKWAVPLGSNVDEEELNDEISGIIHYNATAGGKIERIPGADVPNGFDRLIEYYNRLIDDMSGAREITTGRLPAGLDTASGLALMVEQENEKLAVNSQNYERGMKRVLKRVLRLMKKHYTEERMGRILGQDNQIELISFTGSDLSGEEDINIVQGSSLPEMKSAQQDRIMSLWGAGAIVNKDGTPDANTFLKLMGLGDANELFEQNQLDENKSKMENKIFTEMAEDEQMIMAVMQYTNDQQQYQMIVQQAQMAGMDPSVIPQPEPVPGAPIVRDFYDHEIHIYNHNMFRKSSEYEELPPDMQAFVDAHVQQHIDYLQAPMLEQQQAEQVAAQQAQELKQQESSQQQEHTEQLKSMDNESKLQTAQLKANTALRVAQERGASVGR